MICSIILRLPNKQPEIIYTHDNFNEALNEFENVALDCVAQLGGENSRKITKYSDINIRGFYCCASYNKYTIYQKEKNGWLYTGEIKMLKEFELISLRRKRDYLDLQLELKIRIEITPEISNKIADSIEEYWMNKPISSDKKKENN